MEQGTVRVKRGLADQLKGGVIMDVTSVEQARIAENAGAVAVMALERVPADIRREGGVARMADPTVVESIVGAVSIPVIASSGAGCVEHFHDVFTLTNAESALGAGIFHRKEVSIAAVKHYLRGKVEIRV